MDLDAYVAEHNGEWRRLDYLSRRRRLSAAEADELVSLYQRTATHLSVVRTRSPDPALVARLSRLVLAGRSAMSGGSSLSWRKVGEFFAVGFPLAAYRAWPWWSGVGIAFIGVCGTLMWWVAGHPESANGLIGSAAVRRIVDSAFVSYYSEYAAPTFAFQLWTHNAWLSAQCLASGVLIAPVLWLLWNNALNVGVLGGIMIQFDRSDVFFGMILPHGMLELTGVFVAAGAGLRVGWAWIAPPADLSRGRALAEAGRSGILVAVGLVGLFAVSGLIEAFVTPAPLPAVARITVGALAWLGFLGYILYFGSRASHHRHAAQQEEHRRAADQALADQALADQPTATQNAAAQSRP